METKKKCFKCGKLKILSLFYVHKMMNDGHLNKCIDCAKKDVNKRLNEKSKDPLFIESERTRGRKKYHKYKYKGSKITRDKALKTWIYKFPEKQKASSAMRKSDRISGMEAHHWSYNEEHYKSVIHLTKKDHKKSHRFIVYDQERMMYRTTGNILLDTKESHEKYIMDKIQNEID